MIKAVGVVIPAHDEEDLLPSCLAAVRRAARMLTTASVQLVVVADACDDRTAELARHGAATVVEIRDRNVVRLPPSPARNVREDGLAHVSFVHEFAIKALIGSGG